MLLLSRHDACEMAQEEQLGQGSADLRTMCPLATHVTVCRYFSSVKIGLVLMTSSLTRLGNKNGLIAGVCRGNFTILGVNFIYLVLSVQEEDV